MMPILQKIFDYFLNLKLKSFLAKLQMQEHLKALDVNKKALNYKLRELITIKKHELIGDEDI